MYKLYNAYLDETETFETLCEAVEHCREQDIIYYSTAMNYLIENDVSLNESLGLCADMGCKLENVNSELLATVHYQNELLSSIEEVEEEV